MGARSKQKGNGFERVIAGMLTEWSGKDFQRVPNSGALRWRNKTWTYGDVLPPPEWPLVIECKHHAEVSVDDLLGNRKLGLWDSQIGTWWIDQTLPDCERARQNLGVAAMPWLIWRQNRGRIRCAMKNSMLACASPDLPIMLVMENLRSGDMLAICDFEHFLHASDPRMFDVMFGIK